MTKRRSNGRKSDPFSFENTAAEREAVLFQNGDCPRCHVKSVFVRQCCDKIASLSGKLETKQTELEQLKAALTASRKETQNVCARIYGDLVKVYTYARDTVNKYTLDPPPWSKPLSVPSVEQLSDFTLIDDSREFLRSEGLEPPDAKPHIEQHGPDAVQFALMQAFAALYQLSLQCESLQLDVKGRAKTDEKAKRASREARLEELQQMVGKTIAQMQESTAAHRAAFETALASERDDCAMQLEARELECQSLRSQLSCAAGTAPPAPTAHAQRSVDMRSGSGEAGVAEAVTRPSAFAGVCGTALGVASLQQQALTMASDFRAATDKLRHELADSRRLLRDAAAANAALLLDRAECARQLVEAHGLVEKQVRFVTSMNMPGLQCTARLLQRFHRVSQPCCMALQRPCRATVMRYKGTAVPCTRQACRGGTIAESMASWRKGSKGSMLKRRSDSQTFRNAGDHSREPLGNSGTHDRGDTQAAACGVRGRNADDESAAPRQHVRDGSAERCDVP
jgi:hypothetical protein